MTEYRDLPDRVLAGQLSALTERAMRADELRADRNEQRRWKARAELVAALDAMAGEYQRRNLAPAGAIEAMAGRAMLLAADPGDQLTWRVIAYAANGLRRQEARRPAGPKGKQKQEARSAGGATGKQKQEARSAAGATGKQEATRK